MHRPLVSRTPVVADANAPGHDRPKQIQPQINWGCIFIQAIFINQKAVRPWGLCFFAYRIILLWLHSGHLKGGQQTALK